MIKLVKNEVLKDGVVIGFMNKDLNVWYGYKADGTFIKSSASKAAVLSVFK
jgi:hypothetical protein